MQLQLSLLDLYSQDSGVTEEGERGGMSPPALICSCKKECRNRNRQPISVGSLPQIFESFRHLCRQIHIGLFRPKNLRGGMILQQTSMKKLRNSKFSFCFSTGLPKCRPCPFIQVLSQFYFHFIQILFGKNLDKVSFQKDMDKSMIKSR